MLRHQYAKLPEDIATRYCLLLDPMLGKLRVNRLTASTLITHNRMNHHAATGGSAMQACQVLINHGVKEEKILFLNLVSRGLELQQLSFKDVKLTSPCLVRTTDLISQGIEEHLRKVPQD